jgi:hypothetical protein
MAAGLQGIAEVQPYQTQPGEPPPPLDAINDPRRYRTIIDEENEWRLKYDPSTGMPLTAETGPPEEPVQQMGAGWDAFGRPTYYERPPQGGGEPQRYSLFQDWVNGERQYSAPVDPPPSGQAGEVFSHGPGFTRVLGIGPDELGAAAVTSESWLLRGPQGQVRATAADGAIDGRAGYNAEDVLGARGGRGYESWTGILPAYIDGDGHVTPYPPDLPGWKLGAGVLADTTPLVGALSGPAASGAAGQGGSGSPDTYPGVGSTQFAPGSPHSMSGGIGGLGNSARRGVKRRPSATACSRRKSAAQGSAASGSTARRSTRPPARTLDGG